MLICPKCEAEYEEGYTVCSDCGGQLIEKPEVSEEIIKEKLDLKVFQFIIGILIILFSTIISFKLTSMYFLPNGYGEFSMEQFLWMQNAYHYSFLIIGIVICLPCIICWCKSNKK
ncbi:hypothetical protein G9F72_022185 [Clostridium estertheticum]|uniref:hypothetical protein n=1 Tax=Clostridium estertheticum TaxID=238834 RepID=UPI0013E95DA2|nr:hypothetical protein [Clostridium estertheticum]MBZ9689009.1 hypothetical protein [Clostridium estertheticum]